MVKESIDVVIVGAGPAGLSAALWLGRCGRQVVVFDSGEPRNKASRALHGYLTRDGMAPLDLRKAARREISRYRTIVFRDTPVRSVRQLRHGFQKNYRGLGSVYSDKAFAPGDRAGRRDA